MYEQMDDEETLAEDEAAQQMEGQTLMVIPTEFVSLVRALIVSKKTSPFI